VPANQNINIPDLIAALDLTRVRRDLLAWFDEAGRDLPWRSSPSVYGTWISEIMLQQTTVAAVAPRWHEFLERFPDVTALAAAEEADVLEAWQGLGYYRRARQLHAAARVVWDQYDGQFPGDRKGWLELPGIGQYTAGAVTSIALGLPEAAVDTNVDRILRRMTCSSKHQDSNLGPAQIRMIAQSILDVDRPGDWNQALMDLGSNLCSPQLPQCDRCPLCSFCLAYQHEQTDHIPAAQSRDKPTPVSLSILVAMDRRGVIMMPPGTDPVLNIDGFGPSGRSRYDNLYRGFWQLPSSNWIARQPDQRSAAYNDTVRSAWNNWLNPSAGPGVMTVGQFSHSITRYRLSVMVLACKVDQDWPQSVQNYCWTPEIEQHPLSTLSQRALNIFMENQDSIASDLTY